MKAPLPLEEAQPIVNRLIERFTPVCERVEVAGSVRRQKPMVGDLEVVVIPRGGQLNQLLADWMAKGIIRHRPDKKWGERYKSFHFDVGERTVQADVWIQDPDRWGVNMMIRTGSATFTRNMVTRKSEGGWMPDWFKVKEAQVWQDGEVVQTPEEEDIFRLWGMFYVVPQDRTDSYKPPTLRPTRPKVIQSQQALIVLPDVPTPLDNPFMDSGTVESVPIAVQASQVRGEWPIPLPERFKDWVPPVSPDAGTPAARERRAKEARLACGFKE